MSITLTVLAERVFDGLRFRDEPLRIDIQGDRIVSLRPCGPNEVIDSPVLDARGATVLPGLINAHVHIARGGMFGPKEPVSVAQIIHNLRLTLASGITTIGDMGCAAAMIHALRRHVETHPGSGPSIIAAGPILTAPQGYPLDWMPPFYRKLGLTLTCATAMEARRAVCRVAGAGMNHVKLAIMHRSYADRPLPVVTEPVARAVVAEAHALGLRVFVHAHSAADYRLALTASVDALMHSSFERLNAEMVARVRDSGVYVCPTLWVFDSVCLGAEARWDQQLRYARHISKNIQREWNRFCEAYATSGEVLPAGIAGGLPKTRAKQAVRIAAANLVLLRDAAVPVAFGDDAAYGFCVHGKPLDELSAMHRAGMSIVECLQAATSGAAALLGCGDRGAFMPGKRADLIVVDGDLMQNLSALERVRDIVMAGRFLKNASAKHTWHDFVTATAIIRGLAKTASQSVREALGNKFDLPK